jgi:radical SAM superfamily enzyme YgiQ (UPF0313 family)
MKILLVYPEIPNTFWGFRDALKFISKKAAEPPLGLITVAAMLPKDWELKLIDMNITKLKNEDILWADYVFLGAMVVQIASFKEVVRRCNVLDRKVVAGGPLVTTQYEDILGVDHFILNEAEKTLPHFLNDLNNGKPKHIYASNEFPEMNLSPVPLWQLLDSKKYATMDMQFSRGCPYDCEFCSITLLNGHKPRLKSTQQFMNEIETLYSIGWRGDISIVDDNFIGNRRQLKTELLPALIQWSKEKKYPFRFVTEVSINLADDDELSKMMVEAGFYTLFVGIETPNEESLIECGKKQNLKRNLSDSIFSLQKSGFIVAGGFIVGFDNDPPNIFDNQINFIQKSGIVSAMVGMLNAPTGTKLFKRLLTEKRLINNSTGNNMDGTINFIPVMPYKELVNGYTKILKTIYSQKEFYYRVKTFLNNYQLPLWITNQIKTREVIAFIKLIWKLGILENGRKYFWKLLAISLFKHPRKFSLAMTLAVYGFHFRKIVATI